MMKITRISTVLFFFIFMQFSYGSDAVATITKVLGLVQVKGSTGPSFDSAKAGQMVYSGDYIKVGDPGFCMVIYLDDKSLLKIRESTEFQFIESENLRTININLGKILTDVKKGGQKDFRIETPVSVSSVKGTKWWTISDPVGVDRFYGLEGTLEIFNKISGLSVSLDPGQMTMSTATGEIMTTPVSPEEIPKDPEEELEEEIEEEVPEEEIEEEVPEEEIEEEPEIKIEEEEVPEEVEMLEEVPEEVIEEVEEVEEEEPAPEPEKEGPFNLGFGLGSATIDGMIYNQFAFRPEFRFGKLGIGLDLVLYIDNEGNIRKNEWDEVSDIADKFLYVRWAEKSDPYWFKLGALEGVTLGYGGLLQGYSNMMEFPSVRRVGFDGGVNLGSFGAEIFLANVKDLSRGGTLLGLRGTYKVSKNLPLRIGTNLVVDINQFSGLKDGDDDTYPDIFDDFPDDNTLWNDTDGDGIPDFNGGTQAPEIGWDIDGDGDNILDDEEDPKDVLLKPTPFSIKDNKAQAIGFALDIGYPVLRTKVVNIDIFAELNRLSFPAVNTGQFSRIERKGTGLTAPGIKVNLFKFFNISLEYRIKKDYFVPQFFDQAYDLNRALAIYDEGTSQGCTKDKLIFKDENSVLDSKGYYGSASADLFNIVSFTTSYANMVADTTKFNSFFAFASINPENIPMLSEATAYYQHNNDQNPFKIESVNTVLGYRLGYEVSKGVSLVWDFRQFYRDTGDGLEPVKQTTIETQFSF